MDDLNLYRYSCYSNGGIPTKKKEGEMRMIIDIYNHHISKSVGKIMEKAKYYGPGKEFPYPEQNADPEIRLKLMDKHGVDIQALSQTTPVLLGFGPDDAAEICRVSNTDNYALCKSYPKRFVNICIVSLLDMKSAMKELERSVNELDCRGVTIASNHLLVKWKGTRFS